MAGGGAASYLLPVVTILIHIMFPPFLIVLGITILLASFGKSLGIRKLYVRALIRIFEVSLRCNLLKANLSKIQNHQYIFSICKGKKLF